MKKNILKQWQAEHKKQQRSKKHQFGWFTTLNPNVGNNEYNNAVFNNVMGSGDTDAIVNAATSTGDGGMGESISEQQNVLDEDYSDSRYTEIYYDSIPIEASYTSGYAKSPYGDEDITDIDDTIEFVYKVDSNSVAQVLSDILDEEIPDTYGELDDKERFEFLKANWEELVDRYYEKLKKYFYTDAQEAAIDYYLDRCIDESMESKKMNIKKQIKYFQKILKQDKEDLEFAKDNNFDDLIQASIERRIKAGEDTLNQLYKNSCYDEQSLNEDTVKRDGKWMNVGKDGKVDSGTFRTKKAADAQRRAMFANGYKGEGLNEGKVKDLMIEVEDAGGIETWMIETEDRYAELIHELKYLKHQAPKEIGSGGSFDSQSEIDEVVKEIELELADLENKYRVVVGADL